MQKRMRKKFGWYDFLFFCCGIVLLIIVTNPNILSRTEGCSETRPSEATIRIDGKDQTFSLKEGYEVKPGEVDCSSSEIAYQMKTTDTHGMTYKTFVLCCSSSLSTKFHCDIKKDQ